MNHSLPVMKVDLGLGSELVPFLQEIQRDCVYSNFGRQVREMESEFATLFGVPASRIVSTANATLGIQGALAVMEVKSVVIPSWTFAATAHAALQDGRLVEFGDVDWRTWILDPSIVREGQGAIVTAPFGSEIEIDQAWNHTSGVVVDAAACAGAFPRFSETFSRPWAAVISLHATKVLGIGEGGLVAFSSDFLASRFRQWSNFGFLGSRSSEFLANNAKLPELSAAVARLRLSRWKEEREDWVRARKLVHQVGEELSINPSFSHDDWVSPYWISHLSSSVAKKKVLVSLRRAGIEARDWWGAGCHRMPAFGSVTSRSSLPVTEELSNTSVGLPFFRKISGSEVKNVAQAVRHGIQ